MKRWNPVPTILRRLADLARRERGVVLVEFALVLPILILIILGIIYFGRYMDYSNQLTQLAAQGARWASVNSNPGSSTLQSYIQSQAQSELASGSSDVGAAKVYIYYPTTSTQLAGGSVRVCLTSTFNFSFLGIGSQTVAEYATARIEVANTGSWSTTNNPASMPSQCSMS